MDAEFWLERWQRREIGFHEPSVNSLLAAAWPQVAQQPGRVLVPLCGKSLDMVWLAERGFDVFGCELAGTAVEQFFREAGLEAATEAVPAGVLHRAGNISILAGDFFAIDGVLAGEFDYVYDRAALVALPAPMRDRYARHLKRLVRPGARELLVSLTYDQSRMSGPPFSVSRDEIEKLFADRCIMRALAEDTDALARNSKFRERGLTSLVETSYLLEWN